MSCRKHLRSLKIFFRYPIYLNTPPLLRGKASKMGEAWRSWAVWQRHFSTECLGIKVQRVYSCERDIGKIKGSYRL